MKGAAAALSAWRDGSWDDVCDRCGLCCYEREVGEDGSVAVDLSAPCEFLDAETNLCRVYERRFELCPRCRRVTPATALFANHLPSSCAYLRAFRR